MVEKIADVRAERDGLSEDKAWLVTDLGRMIDAAHRYHEDWHVGVFRYCEHVPCQLTGELEQAWAEVLS
jgi:hypothetical protein